MFKLLQLNRNTKTLIFLIFVAILVLLPSLLLLTTTSWSSDDYYVAYLYQTAGLDGLLNRIFNWSPRFFSEIILYLYYNLVAKLGIPLTGWTLLVTWLFLLSSIFVFLRKILGKDSLILERKNKTQNIYFQKILSLLITLILFIYFLNGHRYAPGEMYYVPVVSVAYLPTLTGIILSLSFLINNADSSSISAIAMIKLVLWGIITASSWEIGTVYQLFFSSCLFLILLLSSFANKFQYLPFFYLDKLDRGKLLIANLISFIFSLYVLFVLQTSRLTAVEDSSINSDLARNFQASFMASISQFFKELLFAKETQIDFYSLTYALLYKLGLLLLLTMLFYRAKLKLNILSRNACYISIIILLATNFSITFSGYYQLGIDSPPRQMSFKIALIGLAIAMISLIIASFLSSKQDTLIFYKRDIKFFLSSQFTLIASFFLTLILIVNFQFDNLKHDLINLPKIIASNKQDWHFSLNSDLSLAVHTFMSPRYVFRFVVEPGIYPACNHSDNVAAVRYINYFQKQKLSVISGEDELLSDRALKNKLNQLSKKINNNLDRKIDFLCSLASGNIEYINQNLISDRVTRVHFRENMEISGWIMNPDNTIPQRVIITKSGEDRDLLINTTVDISRPDIAEYFDNTNLLNSGWKASFTPKPEWKGETITLQLWAYNPDINVANLAKDINIQFRK